MKQFIKGLKAAGRFVFCLGMKEATYHQASSILVTHISLKVEQHVAHGKTKEVRKGEAGGRAGGGAKSTNKQTKEPNLSSRPASVTLITTKSKKKT